MSDNRTRLPFPGPTAKSAAREGTYTPSPGRKGPKRVRVVRRRVSAEDAWLRGKALGEYRRWSSAEPADGPRVLGDF